jgi:hypothetical protein
MLNPATSYYARVKSTNSSSESDYSNIVQITTLPSVQANPPTISPFNPVVNLITTSNNSVTINIQKPEDREGVTQYKLTVSSVSDFSSTLVDKLVYVVDENTITTITSFIPYTSLTFGNLNPATTYYFKLQAANVVGLSAEITFNTTTKTSNYPPDIIGVTSLTAISSTIEWYPVVGAISYRVDVSASPTFSTLIINNSLVTGTSLVVNSLIELTTYYYRVRSFNGSTTSYNSQTYSFTTLDNVATYTGVAINMQTPTILSTRILDTSLSFTWKSIAFSTSYYVEVATNSLFTLPFFQQTVNNTTLTLSSLLPETTYYIRIRAVNSYTSTAYVIGSATTLKPETALVPPVALNPFNIYATGFLFNWVKRNYATNYIIEISSNTSFTAILQKIFIKDIDNFLIEGLSPSTTYYVRVYAASTTLLSSPSAYVSITTANALPDVVGLTSSTTENTATLSWTTSINYVDYELSVFKSIDGTSLVPLNSSLFYNRKVGVSGAFTINILLEPDTLYKWKIKGVAANGDSKESSLQNFTTLKKGAFIQLDSINGTLKWSGELNRVDASTDIDFKYSIPLWTSRIPLESQQEYLKPLLESDSHFYIRGRYESGVLQSKYSNTINTLTDAPIIKSPVITNTSIKLRWKHGRADTYLIQVEQYNGISYQYLPGYLIPIDIGTVDEFVLSNLTANTSYRFTIYYRASGKNIKLIQQLVYKTYRHSNCFTIPMNNLLTLPVLTTQISSDLVKLVFSGTSNTIAYRISKSSTFAKLVEYKELSSLEDVVIVEPSTLYNIEFISINTSGERSAIGSGTFTSSSLIYNSLPITTAPTLSVPTIINSSEAKVSWNAVTNAESYKIEVSEDSNFSILSMDVSVAYFVNNNSRYAIISGLLNTKQYYSRIYAYSKYSTSKYSNSVLIDTSP